MNDPTPPAVMDADWLPADDEDLIRRNRELRSAFDYAIRRQRAYDYLSRVDDRIRAKALHMVQAAAIIFLLAVAAALLVG